MESYMMASRACLAAKQPHFFRHVYCESSFNRPIYRAPNLYEGVDIEKTKHGDANVGPPPNSPGTYCLGRSKPLLRREMAAEQYDAPVFAGPHEGDKMIFETCTVCLKGDQKGT
jgi:hypothetical protein